MSRLTRRTIIGAAVAASTVTTLAVPVAVEASTPPDASVVTHWSTVALRTVYAENSTPVPAGSLYLGFTSLAVYDAVLDASKANERRGHASTVAAAAVAAHDVLATYFPSSSGNLQTELDADLAAIPDSPAKRRGVDIGREAAADMVASRMGDGRGAAVVYSKPVAVGVWRPTTPGTSMAVPWLGFVKPLLLDSPTQIQVDGPDALGSAGYAADVEEVRTMGSLTGSLRTPGETETAYFFNDPNPVAQYQRALVDLSQRHPQGILSTARTFALVNASVADGLITTWRLKYDVGFWRPVTAIHEADADGNPSTSADLTWAPLITTPPYPEYPSGHATVTNAFAAALEAVTGSDATDLYVSSSGTGTTRHYTDLDALSTDALNARIWLGIHFRDAMEDAVTIGRTTATVLDQRLP